MSLRHGTFIWNFLTFLQLTGKLDARISGGVVIIGCPDYVGLMTHRARQSGMGTLQGPHFPASLRQIVEKEDPVGCEYWSLDEAKNPFLGKRVLVICGADDDLVPWSAGAEFVDRLQVGDGLKESRVYEGVGHRCNEEMEEDTFMFLSRKWN